MPTWDEILNEFQSYSPTNLLDKYLKALSGRTGRTTMCYMTAFSIVRKHRVPSPYHTIIDQDMQGFMTCSKGTSKSTLDLILHLPGGEYEATKRIISYLHSRYEHIRVFVPHMAFSGGTLIACAADEIYMGPYSSLSPTDPQVFLRNQLVPARAVTEEVEMAFSEVKADPKRSLLWNQRINQIPLGQLKAIQTMVDNSLVYLKELLGKRNCKGKTAPQIDNLAKFLNSHSEYSSHGQGISFDNAKDKGLNVKNIAEEKKLEDAVLSVYHSAIILFERSAAQKVIVNDRKKRYVSNYSPN